MKLADSRRDPTWHWPCDKIATAKPKDCFFYFLPWIKASSVRPALRNDETKSGYTQEKIRNLNDHCNDDCNSSLE